MHLKRQQRVGLCIAIFLSTSLPLVFAQTAEPAGGTNELGQKIFQLPPVIVVGKSPPPPLPRGTTVIADEALAARTLSSVTELSALAPNFGAFTGGNDRTPHFTVRGLRENDFEVGTPLVALYVDDVPYDQFFTRSVPLFDLDTIELSPGPQGTRFGASSSGGVLNIHTVQPDQTGRGNFSLRYGNYNSLRLEGALGGAVVSNILFLDVSGLFSRRDGFIFNTATRRYADTRETMAGRGVLRWKPVSALDLALTVRGHRFNDGLEAGVPLGQQDFFTVSRNKDGSDDKRGDTESLRATWSGESVKIMSVTSHSRFRQSLLQDSDFQPVEISTASVEQSARVWTQELRVQSQDDDSNWRWSGGAYFSDYDLDSASVSTFSLGPVPQTYANRQDDHGRNYAVFGKATAALGKKLELTAGLRFEYDTRESVGRLADELSGGRGTPLLVGQRGGDHFNALQPRVEAAWKFSRTTRAWISAARGFQPGDFNFFNGTSQAEYKAADAWHYELGGRSSFAGGKIAATATAFYNDLYDHQVFRPTGFGTFVMLNAARAHAVGADCSLEFFPADDWNFWLRGGYVSAVFDDFTDPISGSDYAGKNLSFVPQYTVELGGAWRTRAGWFAQAAARIIGDYTFDEGNTAGQGAYALVDLRAGYEKGHWGCSIFVRNALDTHYTANALHFAQPVTGSYFVGIPGEPAMFGFELSARF